MDRLLAKHELYCTVCEHNTGDCVYNTMVDMHLPIQRYAWQRKPYVKDESNPFYTYDLISASSAGAAWKPARMWK